MRVSGRGLKIPQRVIEELFSDLGYVCEEWIGVEASTARLGIFGTPESAVSKIVYCSESARGTVRCDLLLPIHEIPVVRNTALKKSLPLAIN